MMPRLGIFTYIYGQSFSREGKQGEEKKEVTTKITT